MPADKGGARRIIPDILGSARALATGSSPAYRSRMKAWEDLSSEEKLRVAHGAAVEGMSPDYVRVLRRLAPGVRIGQAFGLWRMARDALVRKELRKGLPPEQAWRVAAERMLQMEPDEAA